MYLRQKRKQECLHIEIIGVSDVDHGYLGNKFHFQECPSQYHSDLNDSQITAILSLFK